MDEVRIPITARDIRNMSFEEMDAIITKFEQEKERRREAEKTNVTNKIFDAIRDAQALGFRVIIDVPDSCGKDIVGINPDDTVSIKVMC